jgi:undecaprenyl-diphosphatase
VNYFEAALLGIVEGLTEFLPVSSTGHLILTNRLLGLDASSELHNAFDVIIQSGAIFAVIWHFRKLLSEHIKGFFSNDTRSRQLFVSLALAFLPAAVVGLLFHKAIKSQLFGVGPVIGALIVGGIAMILIERWLRRRTGQHALPSSRQALVVGLCQCLSMWPGTSRSMTTILGGRITGLSAAAAAEFSFLLAIPTLLAASALDLYKSAPTLAANPDFLSYLAVGMLVSFVTALFVIRGFIGFLKKYSLEVFGWYRIALGILIYLILK